jgi:hypothetical protein
MDNLYLWGFPYDPYSPYGVINYYDPNETQEERERSAFTSLLCVVICFIGFPLAMAIGYGLYRLFGLF